MLGDQLEENVDALFGRERTIEFAVRLFGFFKCAEHLYRRFIALHVLIIDG